MRARFCLLRRALLGLTLLGVIASPAASATPPSVPGNDFFAIDTFFGDGVLLVTWVGESANGSPVTGYDVEQEGGGTPCTATTHRYCEVGGLTNGTNYRFRVRAINAVGTGAWSAWTTPAAPFGAPDAPTDITAATGDGYATLSWNEPDPHSSTLVGYTASATPGGHTCTATPPDTTCTITGLTRGQTYTFSVWATNTIEDGAHGTVDATLPDVTDPPTDVIAAATAGGALIAFSAPVNDHGAGLNYFTVTASPGGATCVTGGVLPMCELTGLSPGDYSFTVTANNDIGNSLPSAPSNTVTVLAAPDPPVVDPPVVDPPVVHPPVADPPVVDQPGPPAANTEPFTTAPIPKVIPVPQPLALKVNGTMTASRLATSAGLSVKRGAKVTLSVAKASQRVCKVKGSTLQGLRRGTCKVTVTVGARRVTKAITVR